MRVVFFSDTHEKHRQVTIPDGDLLIFGGDCTDIGLKSAFLDFCAWFFSLPHRYKVFIRGNHETWSNEIFTDDVKRILPPNVWYLEDELITIEGITIYGTNFHPSLHAFDPADRPGIRREHWSKIPPKMDILMTHAPPHGILDLNYNGTNAGCSELLDVIQRIEFRYHLFGHIHEAAGVDRSGRKTFVNGSLLNRENQVAFAPFCFVIAPDVNPLESPGENKASFD
jgi:Icc-related predicted phosphoesterase